MKRVHMILGHVAAAVALAGATFAAQAGNGEAQDYDPPSLHIPAAPSVAQAAEATLPGAAVGPLTRADVKESLQVARAARTLAMQGDIGDSEEVLARREAFNELQAEVLLARYAEAARAQQQLEPQSASAAEADAPAELVADATLPAEAAATEVPPLDSTVVVTPDMTVRELFARMGEGDAPVTVVMVEEDID